MINYTTIQHDKRKELDISMLEYVLLDTVEKLSKPKFRANRQTLADFIGMSRQGLIKAINRLCEKGLLTRVNGKEIAVTQKWIDETILDVNKVDSKCKQSLQQCKQSLQPTKSKNKELEFNKKNTKKDLIENLPQFICQHLWEEFKAMRKDEKKPLNTQRKIDGVIKLLSEFEADTKGEANRSLEQSIDRCWASVYRTKGNFGNNNQQAPKGNPWK